MTELGQLDVNYTGIEANQILFEPVYMDEDILSSFKVMPNVVNKKKMQFAGKLEKIVRRYTGCGFNPVGGFNVTERTVEVNKMKFDLSFCIDELMDTIFEELLKTGTNIHDLSATVFERILIDKIRQALILDLHRIYFFSDSNSADPNYDQMDGLWTKTLPALVNANLVPYFNTGSGGALSPGDGIDIVRAVYDQQSNELIGLPSSNLGFYVTASVFKQYRADIENGGGGDFGLMTMIEGKPEFTFRGIPIKPQYRWDDIMSADLASPNSHLCLLTSPLNLVLATDLVNPGDDFMIWYEKKEEKLFAKGRWKMGGNYVHPSLFSVGY